MKKRGTAFDFWGASLLLMEPYVRRSEKYFRDLAADLSKGGLRINYRAYVAGTMVASIAGLIAGGVAGFLVSSYLISSWTLKLLLPFGFALLGGASTFSAFYFFPHMRVGSRRRKLDSEMPYALTHMAVLASAGLTPEVIFHNLAEEEFNHVVNQESRMIVRDMSLLGMDLQQALENERRRSPSDNFAEFIDGFVSASRTGTDLKAYLLRVASSSMLDKRLKARAIGESVSMIAEMFTILLIVTPLLLLVMLAVIGIIVRNIGGVDVLALISLMTFAFVPLGGLAVLVVADSTISREMA